MNEKEQAEIDKLNVDKDKLEADTYKMYVDMGVLEPYKVRFLKFGNTLDDIPVPHVQTFIHVLVCCYEEEVDRCD
jgi:hypothetical protein